MAIVLVTYDLNTPGKDYQKVYDYLEMFTHCKEMESVYLLDTKTEPKTIRDELKKRVDDNDVVFVVKLVRKWAAHNYGCGAWLNDDVRNW